MTRQFLIGAAVIVAFLLSFLAWEGWLYLQRGYSLGASIAGQSQSVTHIDFPQWRIIAHGCVWITTMVAVVGYIRGARRASAAAWLAFAAAMLVGIYDIEQYGTMGSPSSIWTVLLLSLLALLARFGPLAQRAEV